MRSLFVISVFLNFIYTAISFILKKFNLKKSQRIPPIDDDILVVPASILAKKIRSREITSEKVVRAYVRRIKGVNHILNAVVEDRFEEALEEARICDKKIKDGEISMTELEKQKPLYGIPFTVKESCMLKGLSYTGGSHARKNVKASDDGEAVKLLRNAGGIPLCVTNTPELCSGIDTYNLLFGSTANPYNTSCTSGGSSGGEGALIGSGCSLVGIGSDIAGSIRIPALFNGIFGHKPSAGIVPIKGHYPFMEDVSWRKHFTIGPIARYADDLHLSMKVLTVKWNRDLHLDDPVDLNKLNVYYLKDIGYKMGVIQANQEIQDCIGKAADHLESCGSRVEKYPGSLSHIFSSAVRKLLSKQPPILLDPNDPEKVQSAICELPKSMLGLSKHTFGAIFTAMILNLIEINKQNDKELEVQRQYFLNLLGDNGIIIHPTLPFTAPIGRLVALTGMSTINCILWNCFGFPATNVPMGFDKDGLPIGLQVIAAPYQDRLCLAVAKELEKSFGGWVPPYESYKIST